MNSQEYTCECGNYKGRVTEGKETLPCLGCARMYIGEYNEKTLSIDAVEVDSEGNKIKKTILNTNKIILILCYPFFFLFYLFIDIKDSIKNFHKDFVKIFKNTSKD